MDKQKIVVVLLIISIALSAITVALTFASSGDSTAPATRSYVINREILKELPQDGGVNFGIVRGAP